MPLVIPGINSVGGNSDERQNWMTKLAGKKIGDSHSEGTFAKQDLPDNHRVIKPDSMQTQDHDTSRLNVHVDKDGTVRNVDYK